MTRLIISCDDLGISEEINLGIQDCIEKKNIADANKYILDVLKPKEILI